MEAKKMIGKCFSFNEKFLIEYLDGQSLIFLFVLLIKPTALPAVGLVHSRGFG
ncbi:hypothetical protein [Prochlorococcus sp. MIT 1303]|uniref:hypothetical protein n=1 Tax=Prochlorococcus sp. MIT 1303 TaxID=1723647 RepID=UPI0007BAF2AF|nr:hypothetical protein [Prochlorococcus sp. MIT 1303]KZR63360.1 hypothetical protein PMIT1303_01726 [Prochlorococcus sp. MIT 1303]